MEFSKVKKHLQTRLSSWDFVINGSGIDAYPPYEDDDLIYNVVLDDFISIAPYLRRHKIYYYYSKTDNCFRLYR